MNEIQITLSVVANNWTLRLKKVLLRPFAPTEKMGFRFCNCCGPLFVYSPVWNEYEERWECDFFLDSEDEFHKQKVHYMIHGWTVMDDAGKLLNEDILPI